MAHSLLMVAPEPGASTVHDALRQHLGASVAIATDLRDALTFLRRGPYDLILFEENLAASDPEAATAIYANAETAPVLEINFGLCGVERIVRQVRSALHRRMQDQEKARKAAALLLSNKLNASLTGLLLESQLALQHAGPEVHSDLEHVIEIAASMREQLRT
jgi:hypothetical protein